MKKISGLKCCEKHNTYYTPSAKCDKCQDEADENSWI